MARQTNDRELLLRYLEGALSKDKTDQMDARLLSDDDFLERMTEARNDLLDAYAAAKLDAVQKERLGKILRRGSMDAGPLGLACALQKSRSAAAAAASAPSHGRGFLWRATVAVICAGIAVAIVFYLKNRTNHNSSLVATRSTAPPTSAQTKLAPSPPAAAHAPSRRPAFALLLGAGVERGGVRSVHLPSGLKDLEVQILLPAVETGKSYEVQVVFPYGSAVKTFAGLIPEDVFSRKLVSFSMTAANLQSGLYTFQLYSEGAAKSTPIAIDQAFIRK